MDEAIKRMRGEPHTQGRADHRCARTRRRRWRSPSRATEIVQKSVKARKIVAPGYAWVRIAAVPGTDRRRPGRQSGRCYAREEPDLKGLVLDLRNDPGGLLQGAIGVAAAFLPSDAEIVSTNGQLDESQGALLRPARILHAEPRTTIPCWRRCRTCIKTRPDGGAGQHRLGLGLGNRRRRPAGPQARRDRRQPDLRQGLGADHPPAGRRHRRQADHGALLHARRPLDPGARHRARPAGRRKRRRRRPERACACAKPTC